MKYGAGNVLTALADMFLPRLCCVCSGELGRNERHICLSCLADMPLTMNWLVRRNPMAEKFNALISGYEASETGECPPEGSGWRMSPETERSGSRPPENDGPAGNCFAQYVHAVALFDFVRSGEGGSAGGYRNITYRLKYSRDIREGRFFAAMLGERAARAEWFSDVDTVIPVPLHWTRRLRRGYNQAEIIAAELAGALGARLRTDILVRRRRTKTQTKLGVEEKSRNVSGAFALSRRFTKNCGKETPAAGGGEGADGVRHILLVDDVFTTGSTLYNCWRPLHAFFGPSVRISVATLGVV